MDLDSAFQLFLSISFLVLIVAGTGRFLVRLKRYDASECSYQDILKYLMVTSASSDVICLVNIAIAGSAGTWPFGFPACELFGFFMTLLAYCTSWIIVIATFERYFNLLIPSDVSSMFSRRNVQIMVTGVIILAVMAAIGPFYGFGDYTYLRGHFNVFVTSNVSLEEDIHPHNAAYRTETINRLFSDLRRTSYNDPTYDMVALIGQYLQTHYSFMISEATWHKHGIMFALRAMNTQGLNAFLGHYHDKSFARNVTDITFIEDVAKTLHINKSQLTADIDLDALYVYKTQYLPIQELGLCTPDMTSPNRHASVWAGFFVFLFFVLPYTIILTVLCIIYCRNVRQVSYLGKQTNDLDIRYTNNVCTIAMVTCVITLIYLSIILSHVDGVYIPVDYVFWVTFIMSIKTAILLLAVHTTTCRCSCRWRCRLHSLLKCFGLYSSGPLAYELSDLELSRTIHNEGPNRPLMTN